MTLHDYSRIIWNLRFGEYTAHFPEARAILDNTALEREVSEHLVPHAVISDAQSELSHELTSFKIDSVGFTSISYSDDVLIDHVELQDCYLLHYTEADGNYIQRDSRNVNLLPKQIQITIPSQRNRYFIPAKSKHISFKIPTNKLEQLCGVTKDEARWLQNHLSDASAISERSLSIENIFSHGQELLNQYATNQVPRSDIELALLLESALGLLFDRKARSQLNIPGSRFQAPPQYLFSAKKIIDNAISESISMTEIASSIGVSDRSLRAVFLQFFGKSPQQYVRLTRLKRLHALISDLNTDDSISNLMLDCGITSWGRYASYFTEEFGYSPSQLQAQKQNQRYC